MVLLLLVVLFSGPVESMVLSCQVNPMGCMSDILAAYVRFKGNNAKVFCFSHAAHISWQLSVACQVKPMLGLTCWLRASGPKGTCKCKLISLQLCGLY